MPSNTTFEVWTNKTAADHDFYHDPLFSSSFTYQSSSYHVLSAQLDVQRMVEEAVLQEKLGQAQATGQQHVSVQTCW